MRKFVIIRCDFEALHCWPECPFSDVSFLKTLHRHKFFVELKKEIEGDRGIEFIRLQREVKSFIGQAYDGKNLGSLSCEMIAEILLKNFSAYQVSVFEDNENGAEVCMI